MISQFKLAIQFHLVILVFIQYIQIYMMLGVLSPM
ncbi:unnamed protein product [Trichobilharzia regenti]|nr:unnamed protein product [Trichobilharzia regenti]